MRYFCEDSPVWLDWELSSWIVHISPLVFLINTLLVYKDSLAELSRSRATHASRWNLNGQYAAFMSHYKIEAAADARQIKEKLVETLGAPIFLDSDDLVCVCVVCVCVCVCVCAVLDCSLARHL